MTTHVRRMVAQMTAMVFADAIAETIGTGTLAYQAALKWHETGEDTNYRAMLTQLDALSLPDQAAVAAKLNAEMPNMEKVGLEYMRKHGDDA